nr:reverse transcriptase domain-containing protein [Tanacetum cinerariifolium]
MKSLVSLKHSKRHLERHGNDLRKCLEHAPHHGFMELTQIDTFYNGLNDNDQDSLNADAGGNLLSKTTREALQIIENKSKVHYSRNKPNVSRKNTTSRENTSKSDDRIDKLADQISTLVDIFAKKVVAPTLVKAVEESCVTCGGAHAYYNCQNTDSNQPSVFLLRWMKAITTRSGVAYEVPSIPTPKKVVERETEETTNKEQTNFHGSTAHIQPPVTLISELDVPKTLPKPNALILMPKFAFTIKSLLTNKDKLFELAKILLNANFPAMLIKKLPKKLGYPGKFLIPWRSFLRTGHALINVYGEEITLRVNDEAVTFNLNQTTRYSSTYDDLSVNRIDIIDVAREEYDQEILGFSSNSSGGNHTSTFEPILSDSSPSLTPFDESDFILKEIDAYLKDESISPESDHADCDSKGDICLIEKLLNNDPFQLPPMDLKQGEVAKAKSSIEEPPKLYPWVSLIHCVPKKGRITVVENENNELIPIRLVTEWRVCIDYRKLNDATRKDHFPLPFMDQMLERLTGNEFYCFLDGFSSYFQIPINPLDQKKTTFTCPYGTFAYCRMPFGLCNAHETFQRCIMAIFHDMIEKTMEVFMDVFLVFGDSFSSCLSHLDTMLQRCEETNLVLTWEKCHFMVKEGIVLGHKISKNRLEVNRSKVDVIAKLPYPTTVNGLRSFLGHYGTENLAADHLSRLENPHKDVYENKDINENSPLETLGKISSGSTPWFADFANFPAGNFIIKGMSS